MNDGIADASAGEICDRCGGTGTVEMEMLSREPWPCVCDAGRHAGESGGGARTDGPDRIRAKGS
jgi:hypothetical protein